MRAKCGRCTYEWEYKGERKHSTTCPDCKSSVRLAVFRNQEKAELKKIELIQNELYDLQEFLIDKHPKIFEEFRSSSGSSCNGVKEDVS